jgi:hypothetical protein
MQITLEQKEIELAVSQYMKSCGLNFDNDVPDVTLVAGRGAAGITASVEISNIIPQVPADFNALPNKPTEDLELFIEPEPDLKPPTEPDPVKTKTKAKTKTKTKSKPAKTKPEPELEPELPPTDLVETDDNPVSNSDDNLSLFGSSSDEEGSDEASDEATSTETLFAS